MRLSMIEVSRRRVGAARRRKATAAWMAIWAAVAAAGCGARQAGAVRGAAVAVCAPRAAGMIGSTLVVHTVCEVAGAAGAPARATRRGGLPGSGDGGAWRPESGGGALLQYPVRGGPDGQPMPGADDRAWLADHTAGAVAALLARGDPAGAWAALNALPAPALVDALDVLEARGLLAAVAGVPGWVAAGTPRVVSVLSARQVAVLDAALLAGDERGGRAALARAGDALDRLDRADRAAVLDYVLVRRGIDPEVGLALAGLLGVDGTEVRWDEGDGAGAGTAAVPGGGLVPLPWAPGRQPRPLYVGNQAHKAIARYYELANPGDSIRSNAYPIASILTEFRALGHAPLPSALSPWELRSRPDIVNLSRLYIYEIKPAHRQVLASRIVRIYLARFGKAGIALALGPPEAPGTTGTVPAPGGWFVFWSPEPGVIVYEYRTARMTSESDHQPDHARPDDWAGDRAPHREPPPDGDYDGDYDSDGIGLELDPPPAPSPSTVAKVGAGLLMLMVAILSAPVSG